jgi:hypothetical protein
MKGETLRREPRPAEWIATRWATRWAGLSDCFLRSASVSIPLLSLAGHSSSEHLSAKHPSAKHR